MNNIVFGPVPSRRLGKSLGVNNIPAKICSYACVYCQLGKAIKMEHMPSSHFAWKYIVDSIRSRVKLLESRQESIDYIAFVPDGEPTLDSNLDKILDNISDLPYKKAIITNGSLINIPEVRDVLLEFDWVSLKVDAYSIGVWQKIDHPHRSISLSEIQSGMLEFSADYAGILVTESMLVSNINTHESELEKIASFISKLNPSISYIAIPTRTPAHKNIKPANEQQINQAFQIFARKINNVEYLIGHEGHDFGHTGNVKNDILSITAVHPMREDSLKYFLKESCSDWTLINELIQNDLLLETEFNGHKFYVRKLKENQY